MFLLMTQDELPKTPRNDEELTREFDHALPAEGAFSGDADFALSPTDTSRLSPSHFFGAPLRPARHPRPSN